MLHRSWANRIAAGAVLAAALFAGVSVSAQERLPWERERVVPAAQNRLGGEPEDLPEPAPAPYNNGYRQPAPSGGYPPQRGGDVYSPQPSQGGSYGSGGSFDSKSYRSGANSGSDAYRPPAQSGGGYGGDVYAPPPSNGGGRYQGGGGYGETYTPPPAAEPYDRDYGERGGPRRYSDEGPRDDGRSAGYYSQNEIYQASHGFFGTVSRGLASVIEYTFQKAGRPNGYILGEDAGGAFVAGLRYGEGRLHTKDAGTHKVYWQGPSLGYDVGAEGSKTMVLVYNLRDPADLYHRFGGVQGSAYLVGGVSVQFQKYGDVVLAPIRSGVGLRLGANVGYLKYTRSPTWNPF